MGNDDGNDNNDDDNNDNDDGNDDNDNNDGDNDNDNDNNDGDNDNDLPNISDPAFEFQSIWKKLHYSNDEPSRTMYQVDRSLDYIEKKLTEIHAIFEAKKLI